jgi:two-component system, sensor histidine kinase and response regulator
MSKQFSMNTPVQQLLDRKLALGRVGGDLELLQEIAVLFLDTYPQVLDEIRTAATTGDAKALERSAHGLKGSVANFGAAQAVEAARHLEALGRAAQLDDIGPALLNLEHALETLRPELETL